MTKMEIEELKTRISAMSKEEWTLVLGSIPFDFIMKHVYSTVNRMIRDRDKFKEYAHGYSMDPRENHLV